MFRPFREHHLLQLLEGYDAQRLPLDLVISNYFRENKALGSKDRAFIAETIYGLVRWQRLLDYRLKGEASWATRFDHYKGLDVATLLKDEEIPLSVRLSFPQELFDLFVDSHGEEQAVSLCLSSNKAAPTTVRANALKITRENLLSRWKGAFDVSPCEHAPHGIVFHKKVHFFSLPEFQQGLFEVQDEGSQLVAHMVRAEPGQQVMDYCSGSGGKTLAFAPSMQGLGQIYLHDIRPHILVEAKRRLRRAGIQNAQVLQSDAPALKKLKKKMDWVLVDVPCSGTGTLRRNPDMKEKIDAATVQRLRGEQRTIFERALSFLKPTGRIVYATCSVLKDENERQIDHFCKTYCLEVEGVPFISLPTDGGMDGFFCATLKNEK